MKASSRQDLLDAISRSDFTPETLTLDLLALDSRDLRNVMLSVMRTLRRRGLLLEMADELSPKLDLPPLIDHACQTISRLLGAETTRSLTNCS